MTDYIHALKQGFEAAQKADLARKEIEAILDNFKQEILRGSDGKILIELRQFEEQLSPIQLAAAMFEPKKTFLAIAAKNPNAEEFGFRILARWKQSPDGYPCSIIIGNQEMQCEDAKALQIRLAALLRNPQIGEILYSLTKLDREGSNPSA